MTGVEPIIQTIRSKQMLLRIFLAGVLGATLIAVDRITPAHINNSDTVVSAQPAESVGQPPILDSEQPITPVTQEKPAIQAVEISKSEPEVQPTAKLVVHSTNCEDYRSLVSQYDWDVNTASAIMRAESGCNPSATNSKNYNGSVDRGLFQVNSIHRDMVSSLDELYDPATNVRVAYRVYQGSGWRAWSVYKSGAYLKYL